MKNSTRFTLNETDVKKWLTNALIFLAPALLVLMASLADAIPTDAKYGVFALYALNVLVDVLKKFVAGKPAK